MGTLHQFGLPDEKSFPTEAELVPFKGPSVVTEEVREFYDRYPYPRPVDSLDEYQRLWRDRERRRADYHLFWPRQPYSENFSILVAGCGTSQAAKHAMRWPQAQVIGIDISSTSMHCTEALKHKYDLENLELHLLPIDRVGELQTTFDQIVCTGVLHHLADPDAGLAALRSVLKPDGVMHLMVYAPYGRTGLTMLHEFCNRVGIEATDQGIHQLIDALKILPQNHPLANLLREAPDFQHEAALADALLHPQERTYSVPQLFEFLERGKMRFGRWVKQAPYSVCCGMLAQLPQATDIAQLPAAEEFAAAELFRGTMLRHSVIAYRDDAPEDPYQTTFAEEDWLQYVPIRMPETICVEKRLPAGAAGVLINQSHSFTDLFMPIDPREKAMLDAIDGDRSIEEIIEVVMSFVRPEFQQDPARRFFERLWWHDQVVFDASEAE